MSAEIGQLRAFLGVDIQTLQTPRDLAEALLPVGDALDNVAKEFNANHKKLSANGNVTNVVERSIGPFVTQSLCVNPTELDYGTSIRICRNDLRAVNDSTAHIMIPLSYRLANYVQKGWMYSPNYFQAIISGRSYAPFATEPAEDKQAVKTTVQIYAKLAQTLLRPLVDIRALETPLIWQLSFIK